MRFSLLIFLSVNVLSQLSYIFIRDFFTIDSIHNSTPLTP